LIDWATQHLARPASSLPPDQISHLGDESPRCHEVWKAESVVLSASRSRLSNHGSADKLRARIFARKEPARRKRLKRDHLTVSPRRLNSPNGSSLTGASIGKYKNKNEEDIVESIFRKSGIECTKEIPVNVSEVHTNIDVLGISENVIILVECVGTDSIGPKSKKANSDFCSIEPVFDKILTGLPMDHKARKLYEEHKSAIDPTKRIFRRLLVSLNEETRRSVAEYILNFCQTSSIHLWTFEETHYFATVADCTYDHCRFEIFEHLQVLPSQINTGNAEPTTPNYVAYGKRYDGLDILNFVVPVTVLLQRSSVKRLQDSSSMKGYQRLLAKDKLRKMRQYLMKDFPRYPNNIICKLHDSATVNCLSDTGTTVQLGSSISAKMSVAKEIKTNLFLVELPDTHDAFEIIDGQHRLFSFSQTKYALYEKVKSPGERDALREGDSKIADLSADAHLIVTAIHSKRGAVGTEFSDPGRLFLDINTTQTRIRPEDVIDLVSKYYHDDPTAYANALLGKLNAHGILENKIRVKFWQEERIKRTSLITYSRLKDIFDKKKKSNEIFQGAFQRQTIIKDYVDFCYVVINNYLRALYDSVRARNRKQFSKMAKDTTLSRYYLFSAVFIGALIRLLRHFLSVTDQEFGVLEQLQSVLIAGNDDEDEEHIVNRNIQNEKMRGLFLDGMGRIATQFHFTRSEFDSKEGWGPNMWGKIEADLFYCIRNGKHPRFGDEKLILKKYRRRHKR
jgi:DGQHR domain-containing protein